LPPPKAEAMSAQKAKRRVSGIFMGATTVAAKGREDNARTLDGC
jgi:hypothetical protein